MTAVTEAPSMPVSCWQGLEGLKSGQSHRRTPHRKSDCGPDAVLVSQWTPVLCKVGSGWETCFWCQVGLGLDPDSGGYCCMSWTSHFTSLRLGFLIGSMSIMVAPTLWGTLMWGTRSKVSGTCTLSVDVSSYHHHHLKIRDCSNFFLSEHR